MPPPNRPTVFVDPPYGLGRDPWTADDERRQRAWGAELLAQPYSPSLTYGDYLDLVEQGRTRPLPDDVATQAMAAAVRQVHRARVGVDPAAGPDQTIVIDSVAQPDGYYAQRVHQVLTGLPGRAPQPILTEEEIESTIRELGLGPESWPNSRAPRGRAAQEPPLIWTHFEMSPGEIERRLSRLGSLHTRAALDSCPLCATAPPTIWQRLLQPEPDHVTQSAVHRIVKAELAGVKARMARLEAGLAPEHLNPSLWQRLMED